MGCERGQVRYTLRDAWHFLLTGPCGRATSILRDSKINRNTHTHTHTWSRSVTEDCRICCHLLSWAWWNCLWSCKTWAHSPAVWGKGLRRGGEENKRRVEGVEKEKGEEGEEVWGEIHTSVPTRITRDQTAFSAIIKSLYLFGKQCGVFTCQQQNRSAMSPVYGPLFPERTACRTAACWEPPAPPDWQGQREKEGNRLIYWLVWKYSKTVKTHH